MLALWDTTGNEVVRKLAAERRSAGGVASGLALTLVVVTDEPQVRAVEDAITIAAAEHPCRLLVITRTSVTTPDAPSRLDAEIVVGGRLGPCEAVMMRMHGRLALHAESVVMPLLAPDVPVVTWWQTAPPERVAYDPLGVVAERRITDTRHAPDPMAALRERAVDYAPGDTDLAWTRITPWRTLVAGAMDTTRQRVVRITVTASPADPSAALLGGWLRARLGVPTELSVSGSGGLESVALELTEGDILQVTRRNGTAVLSRTGHEDRSMPLLRRKLGDELAEELRRLDADQVYATALSAATGVTGLNDRSPTRVHVWRDPAVAERPETADGADRPAEPASEPPARAGAPATTRRSPGRAKHGGPVSDWPETAVANE